MVAAYTAAGVWGDETIYRLAAQQARMTPDAFAVRDRYRRLKPPCSGRRLQAGNARIAIAEPARFAERDRCAPRLTFEGIAGREGGMDIMDARMGAPRLLEPSDRLVGARFKQMDRPDLSVPGG